MTDINKQRAYDEICGAAFVNLYTMSKEINTIILAPFNPRNKEHLFVLGVARGLASAKHMKIKLLLNKWQLRKLNRGIDEDSLHFEQANGKDIMFAIDPDKLLAFMYPAARASCGEDFTFADICDEFYSRKKVKK